MSDAQVAVELLIQEYLKGDKPPPGTALRPASIVVSQADPLVLVDGDTTQTTVVSLIGTVLAGARVMVLFWPPHGVYIVGVLGADSWQSVPYVTGWTDYGSGAQVAEYRRDGPWVVTRGVARRVSGSSSVIATLPEGFRPAASENFAVDSNPQAHSVVVVTPAGDLLWTPSATATSAYVSLSGIRFWVA